MSIAACGRQSAGPVQLRVLDEVSATANHVNQPLAQNSPRLAEDPTDARFVALAHRVDNPEFGCALELSYDGGRSWAPGVPVAALPAGAERCYSPEVAFDGEGVLHYLFIGLHGRGNSPVGAFMTTSADRGRTFSPPRQVLGPERYMVRMAMDSHRGRRGRIHLVWLETSSPAPLGGLAPWPNPLMSSFSDDGGSTFSTPVQISDPQRLRVVAPALALAPDGEVFVLYYDLQDDALDYQGLEGAMWEKQWSLVIASSIDGGAHFRPGVTVDDHIAPTGRVMLITTMPPPALAASDSGQLVAAWADGRSGESDILYSHSDDQGQTWSGPQRLNDDPGDRHRTHYLPFLSVAPYGRFDAVFYDRRNDPADLRNDVYYASSGDGGRTFGRNLKLTSAPSDSRIGTSYTVPSAKGLIEFGSRLAVVSEDDRVVAAWTDTSNAVVPAPQDIFATEVDLVETGSQPREPASSGPARLPVVLREYAIDLPSGDVRAGRVVFEVRDQGRERHQAVVVRLPDDPGFNLDGYLRSPGRHPLGTLFVERVLGPGQYGTFAVDLAPGRYGVLSLLKDSNGTSDASKGMDAELRVG